MHFRSPTPVSASHRLSRHVYYVGHHFLTWKYIKLVSSRLSLCVSVRLKSKYHYSIVLSSSSIFKSTLTPMKRVSCVSGRDAYGVTREGRAAGKVCPGCTSVLGEDITPVPSPNETPLPPTLPSLPPHTRAHTHTRCRARTVFQHI